MLIEELIGHPLILEDPFAEHSVLAHAVDDLILRARKGQIPKLNFRDISVELNKAQPSLYINPEDPEFKNSLMQYLQQNNWVSQVMPTGDVVFKTADELQVGSEGEPAGEELEKEREEQSKKAGKIASKGVKDRAKNRGELEL